MAGVDSRVIGDTAPMIIINTMVVEVTVLIVSSIDLVTNVLELRHVFLGICITDYQQTQQTSIFSLLQEKKKKKIWLLWVQVLKIILQG